MLGTFSCLIHCYLNGCNLPENPCAQGKGIGIRKNPLGSQKNEGLHRNTLGHIISSKELYLANFITRTCEKHQKN